MNRAHNLLPRDYLTPLFLIATFLYIFLMSAEYIFLYPLPIFDQSSQLLCAKLVNQGLLPYADFTHVYTPLNCYMNASFLNIFGNSVISTRVLECLLYLLVVCGIHFYITQVKTLSKVAVGPLTLLSAVFLRCVFNQTWWNAYSVAFLAILFFMYHYGRTLWWRRIWIGVAGFFTGVALLMKLNFGAYTLLAILLGLMMGEREDKWKDKLKKCVLFISPTVVVIGIFLIVFRSHLPVIFEQIVAMRLQQLTQYLSLSLPGNIHGLRAGIGFLLPMWWVCSRPIGGEHSKRYVLWMGCFLFGGAALFICMSPALRSYMPVLALIQLALVLLFHLKLFRFPPQQFLILVSFCLFSVYFMIRADHIHYIVLIPMATLMLPQVMVDGSSGRIGVLRKGAGVILVTLLFHSPVLNIFHVVPDMVSFSDISREIMSEKSPLRGGDAYNLMEYYPYPSKIMPYLYPDGHEIAALQYVYRNSKSEDHVFIGNEDHSVPMLMNSVRSYWLLPRPIGVRSFVLDPEKMQHDEYQQQIVMDLEQNAVEWIVLWNNRMLMQNTNLRTRSTQGSRVLDAYIQKFYTEVATFGNRYRVLRKI